MITQYPHRDYRFGTNCQLNPFQKSQLVSVFQTPERAADQVLGGRRSVSRIQLEGIGAVVIKHYRRGGALGRLITKSYLKTGKTRCQIEFELMVKARDLGVQTPEPITYADRGHIFYHAWLVTREIEHCQSMAQLSRTNPDRTSVAMASLTRQVAILIGHRILHADFHPGNVLIDDQDQVYIIDFDKAGTYSGSKEELKSRYRQRWCRAVQKHSLPPVLCGFMRDA
ncbi:MAG: hypothetical protein VR64_08360 [Desulfatitalea sp. BRH_c12]|nr:MAG: hypothetical protein VR64_08360 [Desulfatitalea sp. BRH_c12]